MQNKFFTKFDLYSILITCIIFTIAFISALNLLSDITLIKMIFLSILVMAIIFAFNSFPVYYKINERELVIKKIFSKKIIEYDSINSIAYSKNIIPLTTGTKGFLGYLGNTMSNVISFSTNQKENLLIKTKNEVRFLISPSNIDEFKKKVEKRLPTTYKHNKG